MGTAATPASPQRNALTQSASAAFNANPNKGPTAAIAAPDRPSSDRPASAAAAATGATQEMDGLRSKNMLREKEVAQLKAALAEAKKEADQWREEFEGLNKAVAAVAQRMAKKP